MTLSIKINGQPYINFESASVAASITTLTRGFSFTSTPNPNNSFPIKIGDEVFITADGTDLLEGYIESLDIFYDTTSHTIRVNGRSKLADMVDSSVPTQFEYDGTSLETIASNLMSAINLDPLVSNEAGNIRDFEGDKTSSEIGQNALEFLESYSRKRQVLLTSDGAKTLVLARTGTVFAPTTLKNVGGATDNNILSSSLTIDNSRRFNQYLVKSQLNPSIPGFSVIPKDTSDQEGEVFDYDIRDSRKLELTSEQSMDSFSSVDRATWEKNIRIGNAFNYQAKVAGNTVKGVLWLPNTLVKVVDEFCQIDATLLIKDIQYDFDLYTGSTTSLSMIKREAFTLEVEQSEREANSKKTAETFII